ncbi:phage protease [Bosea minatitlanensis]|uniref:Phage protease n=1 Tax=Bosea minatitlanensis TaxID=128782 RepID=A0ABW0EYG0_9HYPH|nr:phage protease [Bosea minatitlanensis]MCT4491798.1 phage protease [Bosea minatitlanensis]
MHKRLALCSSLSEGLVAGIAAFEVVMASAQAGGEQQPPEWVQLTPRGAVTARDGRSFRFDPERLAAAFAAEGLQLPIDFEHESEFTFTLGAKPARAWIVAVEARAKGLFGRVEWLPDAVAALKAKAYRYISPTFYFGEDGITARLIKAAALVAAPALGMPALASATPQNGATMLKDILIALGLAETASAADAVSAIALLKAGDPAKFVPKAQHDATATALAAAEKKLQDADDAAQAARCSTLVEDAIKGGKIAPAAKDQYLALAKSNFDGTKAAIDAMPVVLKAGADADLDNADPDKGAAGKLSEAEKAMAATLGVTEEAFLAARAA